MDSSTEVALASTHLEQKSLSFVNIHYAHCDTVHIMLHNQYAVRNIFIGETYIDVNNIEHSVSVSRDQACSISLSFW